MSLFIDLDKDFIFYFDSNGDKIPKRIKIFIDRVIEQGDKIQKKFRVMSNEGRVHQQKDGSCGMYAIVFIIKMLQECMNPEFFIKNLIPDEEVQKYRKIYYNLI